MWQRGSIWKSWLHLNVRLQHLKYLSDISLPFLFLFRWVLASCVSVNSADVSLTLMWPSNASESGPCDSNCSFLHLIWTVCLLIVNLAVPITRRTRCCLGLFLHCKAAYVQKASHSPDSAQYRFPFLSSVPEDHIPALFPINLFQIALLILLEAFSSNPELSVVSHVCLCAVSSSVCSYAIFMPV